MKDLFNMSDWRRKYVLMTENDIEYPIYDPNKHKTLMRGAIDYELNGDTITASLPFEEEPEYGVDITFPVSELEAYLGTEIESNQALQDYDYMEIYQFFHDKNHGLFGKYKHSSENNTPTLTQESKKGSTKQKYELLNLYERYTKKK